ncbi:MAG TPA: transposase [Ignavibacteria bacterium]|nr:transposase [Bacteroidota bacterium]HRE09454.1 transposase [Ignavibacteria bacterium]HRF64578.1 transposase [Ignavibacteria bacterium]HRJ04363.1 transposase [Ignavibacteria bacterium]
MRSTYKIHNPDGVFFITSTIVDWIQVFKSEKYYEILFESIRYSQLNKDLKLFAYVFLPDHFHLVVSGKDLSNTFKSIKGFSAKEIIKELNRESSTNLLNRFRMLKMGYKTKSEFQVWQESFHPKELLTEEILQQKVDYIHMNPVRKGLVDKPEDWKYSSAGYYATGVNGLLHLNGLE